MGTQTRKPEQVMLNPFFTAYTKINSKQILDLRVKAKTVKLSEKSLGVNVSNLKLGKNFSDMIPKVQMKEQISCTSSNLEVFVLQRILLRK